MKHSKWNSTRAMLNTLCGSGRVAVVAAILGLAAAAAAQEHVVINFDQAGLGEGVHAGNIFLSSGVRITSCTAPDAISVGGNITLTAMQPWFELWRYGWAVSAPNYAVALDAGVRDILLSFTVPVTSVEMDLDFYPNEAVDTDRLVVLQSVGSNTFKVLKFVTFTDEKGEPPAKHVSIDMGGDSFSHVLFQTLTELEGFDNLAFDTTGPIPEPEDEGPPGPKPPGSGGWSGGGGGSGNGTIPPPSINDNSSGAPGSNDNKTPESPTTGDDGSVDSGDSTTNPDGEAEVNLNSGSDDVLQPTDTAAGGTCGVPAAIILLCGMLLLRLLSQGGPSRGKP